MVPFARHLCCNVEHKNALQFQNFKHYPLRMRKTYASKFEVCPSNAKYCVIKFNFKYVPPQTQVALWPTNNRNNYIQHIQVASWV